jgi:hypothetical protein
MKFYTNTTFDGVCPVGTAAIVKGRNKKHAAQVLEAELRRQGLVQKEPIKDTDMELWPKVGEQVRILNNGDY